MIRHWKVRTSIVRRRWQYREALFHILGHTCYTCGEFDKRCLQFDHINGNGHKDKRRFYDCTDMFRYYGQHPEEAKEILQVLCSNCNWKKRYEKEEKFG